MAFPPEFGTPQGPGLPDRDLARTFVEGAESGYSNTLRIERDTLVDHNGFVLALRFNDGALVREDVPEELQDTKAVVQEGIGDAGYELAEPTTAMGTALGIELVGLRAAFWDLWAADADTARDKLARRALGSEVVERLDFDQAAEQERVDAEIAELEQRLRQDEA